MALTPVDMHHVEFAGSIRGYNKKQVDNFVRSAAEALETALRALLSGYPDWLDRRKTNYDVRTEVA